MCVYKLQPNLLVMSLTFTSILISNDVFAAGPQKDIGRWVQLTVCTDPVPALVKLIDSQGTTASVQTEAIGSGFCGCHSYRENTSLTAYTILGSVEEHRGNLIWSGENFTVIFPASSSNSDRTLHIPLTSRPDGLEEKNDLVDIILDE